MIKKTCKPILIGTRKSPLALWQANQVNKKIKEGKLITELNKQRLNNIKELSTVISRINNIIFFS